MTTAAAINNIGRGLAESKTTTIQQSLRRWSAALFVSLVLGGFFGLCGLTLGFLTMSEIVVPSTNLYTISTVLIGAAFILFGIAAHCLDKTDDADKAIRLEYCRRHGLKDEYSQVQNYE